ncbi:MAG: hypothetical protein AAF291_11005 [Pseudomonadota bacterium]
MVALTPLVAEMESAQELVVPYRLPDLEAGSYFVVCRKEDRESPVIGAFVDWVCRKMQQDLPQLRSANQSLVLRLPRS